MALSDGVERDRSGLFPLYSFTRIARYARQIQ